MKNQERITDIETTINQLIKEKEALEKEESKIDFSEFVGKSGSSLAIKGEKYLVSYYNTDIQYTGYYNMDAIPDYIHTTVGELEKGDVFITEEEVELGMDISSFNIYVADGRVQYLTNIGGFEIIENNSYYLGTKVIKFLRD